MTGFDTIAVVDWSARSEPSPAQPAKDAIWIGVHRRDGSSEPVYCRTRAEAEAHLAGLITETVRAGQRMLIGFDFPFAYPAGFARAVTGQDDPLALWDWLEARITDSPNGANNRFDVAQGLNGLFAAPGPFWGKPDAEKWPGIPYRKTDVRFEGFAEKRACDVAAGTSSSCFQLFFNPTVGSQCLMGLPVLNRLRRETGVAVWPFEPHGDAAVVLAEIWPGLIEPAVKEALAQDPDEIRDRVQVSLLARALWRLGAAELDGWLNEVPDIADVEGWVLGGTHAPRLTELARPDIASSLQPPPLRDNCFSLPPGVEWTPVDDALALLRTRMHPVTEVETVPVSDALGRVVATPVSALRANPPLANSAVDGYGFAHASLGTGDPVLPLVTGRAVAGAPYAEQVPPGYAVRILTGAVLPASVDTVVLQEDVAEAGGQIAFRAGLRAGANTRQAGEDVNAGDIILPGARVLTAADLALATATGIARIEVRRKLRVAILSTGDELAEPGESDAGHRTYDANRPMLTALAQQFGFDPVLSARVPDDREALRRSLDQAASAADVILTSGGASSGDEDHVSALLKETGAMTEWRIAVKPGRPLALGMWQGKPVFGLPGNPVAAFVCTLIFARPAMGVLAGQDWHVPQGFDLPAGFEKRGKIDRHEYLRARIEGGRVQVFGSEGSGRISGLSWAEGLVELPATGTHIRPGDLVRYIPFGSFL